MATETVNSDNISHEHVGRYMAARSFYKQGDGRDASSFILGMISSVTHGLDDRTGTVTTIKVEIAPDMTYPIVVRSVEFLVGQSLDEVLLSAVEITAEDEEETATP